MYDIIFYKTLMTCIASPRFDSTHLPAYSRRWSDRSATRCPIPCPFRVPVMATCQPEHKPQYYSICSTTLVSLSFSQSLDQRESSRNLTQTHTHTHARNRRTQQILSHKSAEPVKQPTTALTIIIVHNSYHTHCARKTETAKKQNKKRIKRN